MAMTVSRKTKRPRGQRKPYANVLSLVNRTGDIRSLTIDHRGIGSRLWKHLHPDIRLVTDAASHYKGRALWHENVDHSKFEWARGSVHTNTFEGFLSLFKRGIIGVYQQSG
jgi:hypothetical protein